MAKIPLRKEHKEFRRLLSQVLEGALDPADTKQVELHQEIRQALGVIEAREKATLELKRQHAIHASKTVYGNLARRRAELLPLIAELSQGGMSARKMAKHLNEQGVTAPRGGSWSTGSVTHLLGYLRE